MPGAALVLVAGEEMAEEALKRPLASIDILIARDQAMISAAAVKGIAAFSPDQVGNFIDYVISLEETDAQR